MKAIVPGHYYSLKTLDGTPDYEIPLTFVMRRGEKYPGNELSFAGTTLQEVLRASIDRLDHLDGQAHHDRNDITLDLLERAVYQLELRAAELHGRTPPTLEEACYGEQCSKCLHVGCTGGCRK